MIERYSLSPMKDLWTEEAKYKRWLKVELATVEAMAELGEIPQEAAKICKQARINIDRAKEIESEIRHDVLSFVRAVEESIGKEGRYLHKGLTSYDIVDTALSLAMRDALDILIGDVKRLMAIIKSRAVEHKYTLMAGRTHGMQAEPITFGLKLLVWYSEMERNLQRLEAAKEVIAYGKISGSVGTYANVNPEVEQIVCKRLGLKPAKVSTQILQRDRHAQVLSSLAILGASLEKIATEIRNLHRTEIAEVKEGFPHPSSSMPHKRNPDTSETICSLARVLRANLHAALENINLWHERDMTNSAAERIIIPDSFILADYMLQKMAEVIENLIVDKEQMRKNLERSRGLVFSQAVLLKLIDKGLSRRKAHELIEGLALESQASGREFKELLLEDKRIGEHLTAEEIEGIFDYSYYLKHVDTIFARFG